MRRSCAVITWQSLLSVGILRNFQMMLFKIQKWLLHVSEEWQSLISLWKCHIQFKKCFIFLVRIYSMPSTWIVVSFRYILMTFVNLDFFHFVLDFVVWNIIVDLYRFHLNIRRVLKMIKVTALIMVVFHVCWVLYCFLSFIMYL